MVRKGRVMGWMSDFPGQPYPHVHPRILIQDIETFGLGFTNLELMTASSTHNSRKQRDAILFRHARRFLHNVLAKSESVGCSSRRHDKSGRISL